MTFDEWYAIYQADPATDGLAPTPRAAYEAGFNVLAPEVERLRGTAFDSGIHCVHGVGSCDACLDRISKANREYDKRSDDLRAQLAQREVEAKALRAALEAAARSLAVLSRFGTRADLASNMTDLIHMRGYAASRASVARAALANRPEVK